MSFFSRLAAFLHRLARRHRSEVDLHDELNSYVEELSDANIRQGMSGAEGRRAALIEMGGVEQVKEACRDTWSFGWLYSVAADIQYGVRRLIRPPGFFITVVATIGLGLGLNTTLFTLFDAYVLRPLSIHDPGSIYEFTWRTKAGFGHVFTMPEAEAISRQKRIFADVLVTQQFLTRVGGNQLFGQLVSGNYFTMLGLGVEKGRPLLPQDAVFGASGAVVVLGYDAWRNRFGADPRILGRKLYLRGYPVEVIGVAKPGFTGLGSLPTEFWAPLTLAPLVAGGRQDSAFVAVTGRLSAEQTIKQTSAALEMWSKQITADRPESERAVGIVMISRATKIPLAPEVLAAMAPIFVAFALIVFIACANVSNMVLARAMARQREIGIRISLGALRSRLIRQLMTESLLLAIPSAFVGLAISKLTLLLAQRAVVATVPAEYAFFFRLPELSLDIRVFSFVILAALGSTLVFGLIPAIQVTRMNLTPANRGDFGGRFRPSRLRNALVVGQVTVCVLLLICSAVVLRSQRNMSRQQLGLQTRGVFFIRVSDRFRPAVAERIRRDLPGTAQAAVWRVPLHGRPRTISVAPGDSSIKMHAGYNFVSPEYFSVLGIPIVAGRNFTLGEAQSEGPVVILSKITARLFWPKLSPLGQSLRIAYDSPPGHGDKQSIYLTVTVVGIAGDAVTGYVGDGLDATCIYFPTSLQGVGNGSLLVRTASTTSSTNRLLTATADRVAPDAADQIAPMDEVLAIQLYPFRLLFWISACLGGLALLLAASGIYGVMAYLVNQRAKEFGIRMALGATAGDIVLSVLSQSLRLTAWGAAAGVLMAVAISPLFAHELEAVNPYDGFAYIAGVLLAMATALAASFFPSYRAARIAPATSLRCD